jgi:hypothetical protein
MFMFPEAQGPKLDKTTVDHIVESTLKYADQQFKKALQARGQVLVKFRLSRALGALTVIKPYIGVNPRFDSLMTDCNELWKNAIAADYDEEDIWLYGDIHDISEF